MPFGGDRKGSCSAADIQDRLPGLEARQPENLLSKRALPTKHCQPKEHIITSG